MTNISKTHASEQPSSQRTLKGQRLPEPWYRVGMVWMIIALPLLVVVASMVTVTIAHQNAPQVINASK